MENIAAGEDTGRGYVVRWLIDDRTPSRGHRLAILSPEVRVIGAAVGPHKKLNAMAVVVAESFFEREDGEPGWAAARPASIAAKSGAEAKPTSSRVSAWDAPDLDAARFVEFLSDVEKEVILEINKARTDPSRYADECIRPRLSWFIDDKRFNEPVKGEMESQEGPAAIQEAIDALKSTSPVAALSFSRGLHMACSDHVQDMDQHNLFQHEGSDGSGHRDRASRYGQVSGSSVETIAAGDDSGKGFVCRWLVDDGTPSRGHRKNVLRPDVRVIGVAVGPHQSWGVMAVMVSATAFADQ
jgi:uncharacterized protein YkwD